MKEINILDSELKYIYLKALKGNVMTEKVEEIENQCKMINAGDYIKEVISSQERKEVYKTFRVRKFIECLKNIN